MLLYIEVNRGCLLACLLATVSTTTTTTRVKCKINVCPTATVAATLGTSGATVASREMMIQSFNRC